MVAELELAEAKARSFLESRAHLQLDALHSIHFVHIDQELPVVVPVHEMIVVPVHEIELLGRIAAQGTTHVAFRSVEELVRVVGLIGV